MALKKEDVKRDDAKADVTTEEGEPEKRADTSASREQKPRKGAQRDVPPEAKRPSADKLVKTEPGVKAYVNVGPQDVLTLEIGGTRYEFRKGSPVHLPPGQSVDHPDIEEVK